MFHENAVEGGHGARAGNIIRGGPISAIKVDLTNAFPALRRVTIHDCGQFDFDWAKSLDPNWIINHPFAFDLDFAEPIKRDIGPHVTSQGVGNWREATKSLAVALWVYQDGDTRPGESILLSQPTMLAHVLFLLNNGKAVADNYNGKDLTRDLHPMYIREERFPRELAEKALEGKPGDLEAFLDRALHLHNSVESPLLRAASGRIAYHVGKRGRRWGDA